jgi:hypothetical protein
MLASHINAKKTPVLVQNGRVCEAARAPHLNAVLGYWTVRVKADIALCSVWWRLRQRAEAVRPCRTTSRPTALADKAARLSARNNLPEAHAIRNKWQRHSAGSAPRILATPSNALCSLSCPPRQEDIFFSRAVSRRNHLMPELTAGYTRIRRSNLRKSDSESDEGYVVAVFG